MRARSFLIAGLVVSGLAIAGCREPLPVLPPETLNAHVATLRQSTEDLEGALKSVLVTTLQEEGPVAAISVCHEDAPEIASRVSTETGVSVGRTSLRLRSQANAPDAWEREQIRGFLEALAAGSEPASLEIAALRRGADGPELRYMRPIMTGDPCTICHGANLAPEIEQAVLERYPDDKATGFAPGDLRGAFTATLVLDTPEP